MSIFPLRNKNSYYVYRSLAPVAVSQILNSLEALTNKDIYQDDNYLRGILHLKFEKVKNTSKISKIVAPKLSKFTRIIDSPKTVTLCSLINICGCCLILLGGNKKWCQACGSAFILGNNKLLSMRTHYGRDGADQMGTLILSYRLITSFVGNKYKADDLYLKAVNAQTCLSYLVPGIAKAASSSWIRGVALEEILNTDAYGSSPVAMYLKKYPKFMKYLTWGTIIWETGFPVVYIVPEKYVSTLLNGVKGFHLSVAFTMGLPRFFWGFMGAHAAVEYVVNNKNSLFLKRKYNVK